jgi:hypothetical protein
MVSTGELEAADMRPVAGSSTRMIEGHESDASAVSKEENKIVWKKIPGQKLKVRSSSYKRDRVKVPSPGELYECTHVDFIESDLRIPNISDRVRLPDVSKKNADTPWHAPDVFVMSISLPISPKAGKGDGPSTTIVMYYAMKSETRKVLEQIYHSDDVSEENGAKAGPTFNAVRLFNEWCKRAANDPTFMARFKLIVSTDNLEDSGLPNWISRWNGKPVLVKRAGKTGYVHKSDNVMEMEVCLHGSSWATKQAAQYMRDQFFHKLLLNFGCVIEARDDTELPEVVVGLCQLCKPAPHLAASSATFFGKN